MDGRGWSFGSPENHLCLGFGFYHRDRNNSSAPFYPVCMEWLACVTQRLAPPQCSSSGSKLTNPGRSAQEWAHALSPEQSKPRSSHFDAGSCFSSGSAPSQLTPPVQIARAVVPDCSYRKGQTKSPTFYSGHSLCWSGPSLSAICAHLNGSFSSGQKQFQVLS